MYALAINGSPRKGGNTEQLLNEVLGQLDSGAWETEVVKVGGTAIRGCIACQKCFEKKDNSCAIEGDGFNEVFAKMVKADAILFGSPTYFADVSADLKALLERAGYVAIANGGSLAGKVGAGVVAVRRAGSIHAFNTINHTMHLSQMVMTGSTYWNLGIGREKGDIQSDGEGLNNMRHLGKVIDWLCKTMEAAPQKYPVQSLV